jgi:hypothetical protein
MRDEKGRFVKGHEPTGGVFKVGHGIRNTGKTRFKKGVATWLGKTHTEETKKKISEAQMGRKAPKTAFIINDQRIVGENNPNWKGGVTPKNTRLRNIPEAREWRIQVFKRDNYTCQGDGCGQYGGKLQAHHIRAWSTNPELRLDTSNGITLCVECHEKTDNYKRKALTI